MYVYINTHTHIYNHITTYREKHECVLKNFFFYRNLLFIEKYSKFEVLTSGKDYKTFFVIYTFE